MPGKAYCARKFFFWFGMGMLVCSYGCAARSSESLPQRYLVTGTVQCDGKPLAKGKIVFEGGDDAELALAPATATIVDGSYEIEVASGQRTVRIFSPEDVGEPDVTGIRSSKETIASKFNTKSSNIVEISPGDANVFDFEVTSR